MTDLFTAAADRPDQLFPTVRSAALDWQDGGAPGFWIKPLHHDAASGRRTLLMKVDAGAYAGSHAHDQVEEVYVIEGRFYDQTGAYGPGDFILRPVGAAHTAGSDQGALVLLVYYS